MYTQATFSSSTGPTTGYPDSGIPAGGYTGSTRDHDSHCFKFAYIMMPVLRLTQARASDSAGTRTLPSCHSRRARLGTFPAAGKAPGRVTSPAAPWHRRLSAQWTSKVPSLSTRVPGACPGRTTQRRRTTLSACSLLRQPLSPAAVPLVVTGIMIPENDTLSMSIARLLC
eukprot:1420070-Rhodomonas_salina.1